MVYLRKAFTQRESKHNTPMGGIQPDQSSEEQNRIAQASSHMRQVAEHRALGTPYTRTQGTSSTATAAEVDRKRREEHYQQSLTEYSAKIPNRYTSINYM